LKTTIRILLVGGMMALLAACSSGGPPAPADRYYSLVLAGSDTAAQVDGAATLLVIGPIRLADFLHRPGIAIQIGPNSVQSAERHRWAEPLDASIGKVLAREIERHSTGLVAEPENSRWDMQADCRLRLEFDAFHPSRDGRAIVNGRYWISDGQSSARHSFALERGLDGKGYERAVDVLREMLGALGQQIAAEITSTGACESPGEVE